MNILFYEYGVGPFAGGVQRVSYNVAKQLKGENNTYVCYMTDEKYSPDYDEAFSDHINIQDHSSVSHKRLLEFIRLHRITSIINQSGFSKEDTAFLHGIKLEYDVMIYSFIHIAPTGSMDVLGYRDWNFPKLVLRSLAKEFVYFFYKADSKKYQAVYELSDKIVLLSEFLIDDFKKKIRNQDAARKICAIPNMVSYPPQDKAILSAKQKKILVVARMGETQKRLSRVLYAWRELHKSLYDWELLFVGDGSDLPRYKELARKMDLPRLTFAGQADPHKYYEESSIFLMTSATEGFGMTILEAMQFGVVPVVMDSCKAFHEILTNGENGFITENKSLPAFRQKIVELANDNKKRQRMAQNAMDSASRFYPDVIIACWKQLLGI